MILLRIGVKFAIFIGLFAQNAGAEIYRLSHLPSDDMEMVRPKKAFPNAEKVYRVINLTAGAPFSSFNSEFVVHNGELKRIKSEKVNHVLDLILAQTMENLACEKNVTAGTKSNYIAPFQAWTERTIGPIDHQALREMNARKYVTAEEAKSYANSTHAIDAERMIYLESLSWHSATEVRGVFDGKIPWSRIAEVEARPGLGSHEIRKLAEAGDLSVKLRVRRATIRVVSAVGLQASPDHQVELFAEELPFESEYKNQEVKLPADQDPIIYRYELGRASQIAGLEHEAEQLSALAGLVIWHHSMSFEDLRTNQRSDVRAVDAEVFMHALKRTHHFLYTERFGAKDHVRGNKPHDVVLKVTLKQFLAKTLPTLGLDSRILGLVAVKADSMQAFRWDFDWVREGQVLTKHHPVTIRTSQEIAGRILNQFTSDVEDVHLRQKFIGASLEGFDQMNNYYFPESRTVDAYDHEKHAKIASDYFISGLDMWTATNRSYVPAFIATLAKFFTAVDGQIRITVVVPQTPGGDRHLVQDLVRFGFEYVKPADDLDFWNGPHAARITVKNLKEAIERHPELKEQLAAKSEFVPGFWRAMREINLLPGL